MSEWLIAPFVLLASGCVLFIVTTVRLIINPGVLSVEGILLSVLVAFVQIAAAVVIGLLSASKPIRGNDVDRNPSGGI